MRVAFLGFVLLLPATASAVGESDANGFPNWPERVIHEWMNRARADPQVEMQKCGAACADAACYTPIAPLAYDLRLNRAARFHSDEMRLQNYFAHDSQCTVVPNINMLYPVSCDGSATCACMGGTSTCAPGACTTFSDRVSLFQVSAGGEIIAGDTDPDAAFYQWMFEAFPGTACQYTQGPPTNGHRWNILKSTAGVGAGVSGPPVGDFSFGGGAAPAKIPSGAHYPRQAASIEAWASWYDTLPPSAALVNVDGTCSPMTRQRGADQNGAWMATLTGLGSGCHRYYFLFKDGSGAEVDYPTTGSLGIGPDSCAVWDTTRPAAGTGCDAVVPPGSDGGTPPGSDGGSGGDAGGGGGGGGGVGCGCRLAAGADLDGGAWILVAAIAFLALRRVKRA